MLCSLGFWVHMRGVDKVSQYSICHGNNINLVRLQDFCDLKSFGFDRQTKPQAQHMGILLCEPHRGLALVRQHGLKLKES